MIPGFLNSLPTFQGFITKRLKLLSLAILWATLALTSHAVEFSTVAFGGNQYTVCRIDVRKERLQLFHRDENGQPFKRFDRLAPWLETRGQKLTFAMNAGMYHADFSTVGLFVSGGRQDAPLNTANGGR